MTNATFKTVQHNPHLNNCCNEKLVRSRWSKAKNNDNATPMLDPGAWKLHWWKPEGTEIYSHRRNRPCHPAKQAIAILCNHLVWRKLILILSQLQVRLCVRHAWRRLKGLTKWKQWSLMICQISDQIMVGWVIIRWKCVLVKNCSTFWEKTECPKSI